MELRDYEKNTIVFSRSELIALLSLLERNNRKLVVCSIEPIDWSKENRNSAQFNWTKKTNLKPREVN